MVILGRYFAIIMGVSYCYLGYVDVIGSFSLGIISVFMLSLLFGYSQIFARKFFLHRIFILLLVVGFLCIFVDTIINQKIRLRTVQQFVTPLVIFFCAYSLICFLHFTKLYLYFISSLIILSCLVAIFQGLGVDTAWDLRYALPVSDDKMVEIQLSKKQKPAGLAFYAVQLGYQMILGVTVLLILHIIEEKKSLRRMIVFGIIIITSSAAIGLNLSGLIACLVTLLVYSSSQGNFKFSVRHIAILIFIPIIIYISPIGDRIFSPDASMLSRITFIIVGIILLFNNPFGVSTADLYIKKSETISQLFGIGNLPMLDDILDMGFHNSFLNIGIQLGWIGFLIYIYLYIYLVRYYFLLSKEKNSLQSKLGSAGLAFMIGYFIQPITHNSGPLNLDIYFWIGHGLILGLLVNTRTSSLTPLRNR